MAININRYIDITSGVGAGVNAPARELIGRFFTANIILPPNTYTSFTSAADVGAFFGTLSEEYLRAVFYFSWVSKALTQPGSIQFARWVNDDIAPLIFSLSDNASVAANWTSISDGSLGLTIAGTFAEFTALDFTAATTLADVATIIQTAINGETGTMWTDATVTYDGAGGFNFVGGDTAAATISVQNGNTGTDISVSGLLGWTPGSVIDLETGLFLAGSGAIWADGSLEQVLTTLLDNSVSASNNFGSIAFLNNLALTIDQITEIATWNYGQNNMYLYSVPVLFDDITDYTAALDDIGGVGLTLILDAIVQNGGVTSASQTVTGLTNALTVLQSGMPVSGTNIPDGTVIQSITNNSTLILSQNATGTGTVALTFGTVQFPEQVPMMIEASTKYDALNSVQNYMFQTNFSALTATVDTNAKANTLDALRINYYGSTQTAGTIFKFYQRGVLLGPASSPRDMNVYVNEIWLKDAVTVAIINLFLNLTQIAANQQGRSQVLSTLQTVINQALNNGTISVNKTLTNAQIQYITQATGDPDAWYQVQTIGYWVDCEIVAFDSPVQYKAVYTLIYSKDDVIRLVEGNDILI